MLTDVIGAARAFRWIAPWAVSSCTGLPWGWSEGAVVEGLPLGRATTRSCSVVIAPKPGSPCLWSSRAYVVSVPTTGASPIACVVTVVAGLAPAALRHVVPSYQ